MGSIHSSICLLEFFGALALAVYGLVEPAFWPPLFWVSLAALFTLPLLNEAVLTVKGNLCRLDKKPEYLQDGS